MAFEEPHPRIHRSLQVALFFASITWVIAAGALATRAARGLAVRLQWSDGLRLLDATFLLFLLAVGFSVLEGISTGRTSLRETIGLPRRPSAGREWATGVAIGWGVILVSVFSIGAAGALHIRFWLEPRAFWLAGLNLATAAVLALATEIAFRGYPYRRLIEAIGPLWATVVLSVVFGVVSTINEDATYLSTLIAILLGLTLSFAWLRTHGLWLGWGLRFAWIAALGILFGLPVAGADWFSSTVQTRAIGRLWLTGGDLGPEGALLMPLLLIAAMVVLFRVTRDWAWHYTHKPIVAGGYPMDVAPPQAHVEMETKAASAPALVQIQPVTPQSRSVETETR